MSESPKQSRRAIAKSGEFFAVGFGHLGSKFAPQLQVLLKGFYKFVAIYCHAGPQKPAAERLSTLSDAVKRKAGGAIYYCAGDCAVSTKRALTHPISDVAGSVTCTQLLSRPITRSFSPFCAILNVSAVGDGAFRTLT